MLDLSRGGVSGGGFGGGFDFYLKVSDLDKEKVRLAKNLRGTVINKRYKIGATEIKEKV